MTPADLAFIATITTLAFALGLCLGLLRAHPRRPAPPPTTPAPTPALDRWA